MAHGGRDAPVALQVWVCGRRLCPEDRRVSTGTLCARFHSPSPPGPCQRPSSLANTKSHVKAMGVFPKQIARKTVQRSLKKSNMGLPGNPATLLLDMHPQKSENICSCETCIQTCKVALFTRPPKGEHPKYPSSNE